jgi:hypothetical protein
MGRAGVEKILVGMGLRVPPHSRRGIWREIFHHAVVIPAFLFFFGCLYDGRSICADLYQTVAQVPGI